MADNRPLFDDKELPDWLTAAGITHADEQAQSTPPAQPSTPPPPQPPAPVVPPAAAAVSAPAPKPIKKLDRSDMPPDSDPNLTYEEWERRQLEQEQAALRTPEDDLLDAVPDWIDSPDAGTASPSTGSSVELTPAWFSGLEEQSPDDAPDWFKPDEIASTSLSGPMAAAAPTAAHENPSGPPAPLPDWMRGDVGGSAGASDLGMDFDALFGSSGAEAASGTPEPEIGGTPVRDTPITDDLALDWMSDLPNLPEFSAVEKPLPDSAWSDQPGQFSGESLGESYDAFASFEFPSESSAATDSAPQADDMPDWMRGMTPAELPAASSGSPSRPAQPDMANIEFETDSGSLPDWLSEMGGADSGSQTFQAPSPSPAGDASQLPEWMAELQPNPPARTPPDARGTIYRSRSPMADAPPPTQNASDTASHNAADLDLSGNVSSADIDTLLSSLPTSSPVEPDSSFAAPAQMDFGSISLDDSDLDQILGPIATPSAALPAAPVLPLTPSASVPRRSGRGSQPPAAAELPISKAQIPDSVLEQISSDEPVRFSIGPVQVAVQESSLSALSDQLRQLRDRAVAFQPPPPSPTATAGPLADIAGTLAIEPIVVQAATVASPAITSGVATDMQWQRVDVIRRILEMDVVEPAASDAAIGASSAAIKPVARPAIRIKVDRLVVTLLLLAALVAPFFTNVLNVVAPPDASAPTAEQAAVYKAIDSISSGHLALMAFEYGPTGANEMDDLARVLLRDLFKHGVKPVIVSTNFAGAMHADALLNSFGHDANELKALNRTTDKPLIARQDYVVLRYLPSGAAGVRSVVNAIYFGGFDGQTEFTLDVEGQPSGLSLATDLPALQSSPAIVLAESPEDVRNWAEQYQTPSGAAAGAPNTRIVLGVSAAAAATARAYSTANKTIIGPLIGLRDATLYQLARQPPATAGAMDRLNQRWQSVGLGALVAAVLILFGALFSLLGALRRQTTNRRPKQAQAGGRR